jgi:hypothetical protein
LGRHRGPHRIQGRSQGNGPAIRDLRPLLSHKQPKALLLLLPGHRLQLLKIGSPRVSFSSHTQAAEPPGRELKSRTLTLSNGTDPMPDNFTYKQSYQIKGRSQEGLLLSKVNGQFGIADVIGYYNCAEDPHGSMKRLFTKAEFWNVLKTKNLPEDPKPKERALQCIALAGEGKALDLNNLDAGRPSPGELLESILRAIIGES